MKTFFIKTGLCLMAACFTLLIAFGCKNNSSTDSEKPADTISEVKIVTDTLPKDTIDIDTYMGLMESMINNLKQLHINKPEDSLLFEGFVEKWNLSDNYAIRDFDRDEIKHSVKVRFLQLNVDLLSELFRLENEAKAASILDFEEEDVEMKEEYQLLQHQLWLETH